MTIENYIDAEDKVLARYGVPATRRFVDVPAIDGRAHVLVTGEGPPVMMIIGGGPPPGLWAPLMAQLTGFTLFVVDPPGLGLTSRVRYTTDTMRSVAVGFLARVADALGLERPAFIAQSMGGLWSTWLALDHPERVAAITYIGCPAFMLGTSAPLPLRVGSMPMVSRLVRRLDPPSPKQVDRFITLAGEDWSDHPELKTLFLEFERLPDCGPALFELIHAGVRLRGPRPEVELTADQLSNLRQPVQMIWGDNDTFGPPSTGRRAVDIIPDAELHIVSGGHAPWVNQPERIADLATPFLRTHVT